MILTLRALRTNYDLDAKTVAEANGITYQTLLKYENDSSNIPVSLLKSLSKYYKVPMDNIFLGKKSELNRTIENGQKGTKMKTLKKAFEKIKDVIDDWLWSYTGLMISCTFLAIVGSILGSIVGVGVFLIIKLILHKLFGLPFTVD